MISHTRLVPGRWVHRLEAGGVTGLGSRAAAHVGQAGPPEGGHSSGARHRRWHCPRSSRRFPGFAL